MRFQPGLLVALGLTGCGTFVTVTPLNGGLPPRPEYRVPVDVFSSGPPTRPHDDVALLEVEQTHGLNAQGTDVMLHDLRRRAEALGCDGIVLGGFREHAGGPDGTAWNLIDPSATTLHATCIVYRDDDHVGTFARARASDQDDDRIASRQRRQRIDGEDPR
ncbi:MAG: hypothetical protein JWM82_3508 [Myxococcales bacterium]|nr:hypothetical protein [Myxococcales bacterium]